MTIKVRELEFAKGVVISAVMPSEAGTDEYKPWSMDIHNAGGSGIFGGGIVNYSGPGNIIVLWQGEETVLPPSPTGALILHYVEAQPNCTHLVTSGSIKFMAEGTYVIQVHGVHQEPDGWWSDDYREFAVVVSGVPPGEYCSLSGVVTGLFGMAVGGAIVELNGEKRETNAAGEYAFISVSLGTYKLTVTKEPWYSPKEKSLSLTEADKEYTEDVGLSLKSYIMYGVPLAVIGGVGGVVYVKRVRAPAVPEVCRAPPGYVLMPKAPPGYRLERE